MNRDFRIVLGNELPDDLDANYCLFLHDHDKIVGQWEVNSFDARYRKKMGGTISRYKAVSPFGYETFAKMAIDNGYTIVFLNDPTATFAWYDSLNNAPGVTVNSDFPNTVGGLLPFQVQGINFAKMQKATVFNWSTGTGKSCGACALTKYHQEHENFDLCLYVVKAHYKIGTQRALESLTDLNGIIVRGTPKQRDKAYLDIWQQMKIGERPILVMNYETFRNDKEALIMLVEGQRVFCIFDEMPNKLKHRKTSTYRALVETLYTSFSVYKNERIYRPQKGSERPSELRTLMLSATPIENSPDDWYSCVSILSPEIYGTVGSFHKRFVVRKNRWHAPVAWRDEDLIGAMAAHITHQVDKSDPDIAKQFPKIMPPETLFVDLDEKDQKIYDALADEYEKMIAKDESMLRDTELLGAINVLQMICSNPLSVLTSANKFESYSALRDDYMIAKQPNKTALQAWESKHKVGSEVAYKLVQKVGASRFDDMSGLEIRCSKLQALRDCLEEHRGKAVVFTRMNASLLPLISKHLSDWNIKHVAFHGELSEKRKQAAQDAFKSDPDIKVFLSSDSGSDSINLEEADMVIHYDRPYKWATMVQRENRAHRLTSKHESVRFITLMVPNSVEDRMAEIVKRKQQYHQSVFKGEIAEQATAMRRDDLLYILTGKSESDDGK